MRRSAVAGFLFCSLVTAAAAAAQGTVPLRPLNAARDSVARDSTARDTTRKEIIKWTEPDSVMRALIERTGYSHTRYQGDRVVFDARRRTLSVVGNPSGVGRAATVVVGDTILYNDSTKVIVVRGDTSILRDPSQNADDVVSHGGLTYNIATRRGSVSNISTAVESGERWFVRGAEAAFAADSTGRSPTAFFVSRGNFTTCDDSIPHYFFRAGQIKLVSKTLLVARPAVLYIGEVPVMWLPFMFQDIRSGRRGGILTPRFGVSEVFRNSPTYRRQIENIGYYFAISDYLDSQIWLDWRSGARPSEGDPGWSRYNAELRYRWLSRFITGRIATFHDAQRGGSSNTALSIHHEQQFSATRRLSADVNYVTNTSIQRSNSFDPRQVMAVIASLANYQQLVGPASVSLGGDRKQYPGRKQVDQNFPNFDITTPTIELARWLEWSPGFHFTNSENFNLDQQGTTSFRYFARNGAVDSTQVRGDRRSTTAAFTTPIKVFGWTWSNSFTTTDTEDNYPLAIIIRNTNDSGQTTRVFSRTYRTDLNWETGFSLPSLFPGTWNLSPSVSFSNVDPGPFMIRSQFSGGKFVAQTKRPTFGVSISPTFFALLPGFGPVARFRHSITTGVAYGYAARASVSDAFLDAKNETRGGYLGALAQNQLTLSITQNLEAKLKNDRDSSTAGVDKKLRVLSLNFSALAYDFERKRASKGTGWATDRFSYTATSDLLPGFNLQADYSLFQGSLLSDTAVFKPYRESLSASFSINRQSGLLAAFSRLFGRAVPQRAAAIERLEPSGDDAMNAQAASTPVAGSAARDRQFGLPATKGFQASFTYSSQTQRPPVGGNIVDYDPAVNCQGYINSPIAHDLCLAEQARNPTTATPFPQVIGAPFIRMPARQTVNGQMSFNITPNWSAQWSTLYDIRANAFASQQVSLQRDLHDWRSTFAFTKAPNGNFAFSFFIALKAQPDLKFDYNKQTYRPSQ